MAKRRKAEEPGIPDWIVTYGDLMSLLLCFFILLAAFSELKQPREFREVIDKIREALGFQGGMGQAPIPDSPTNATINMLEKMAKREDQSANVNKQNQENVVGRHDKVSVVHEGNWHAIGGSMAFDAGSTELTPSTQKMLREDIAPKLKDRTNIVRIIGHAWGFEDTTAGSPMEVSFARALAAHDYLVEECGVDPALLRVVASADVEPAEFDRSGQSGGGENRRVQVYMTDRLVDQIHPDPYGTGRGP
ncbi:MAG: flagellar motor protein MotB [Planctomycetota bacterium]